LCRCCDCGIEAECTPSFDFYGEVGKPLRCESCMLKHHNVGAPMLHMIPGEKGWMRVTVDKFAAFVMGFAGCKR